MARPKMTHSNNLDKIKDIISRQLALIDKASSEGIINDRYSRMFCEYAKITLMALKEERDSLKNIDIESMSDSEIRELLKQEVKDIGGEIKTVQ